MYKNNDDLNKDKGVRGNNIPQEYSENGNNGGRGGTGGGSEGRGGMGGDSKERGNTKKGGRERGGIGKDGKSNSEYNQNIPEIFSNLLLLRVININQFLGNLIKLYNKDNKYNGQNNNFTYKYSIFLNNC